MRSDLQVIQGDSGSTPEVPEYDPPDQSLYVISPDPSCQATPAVLPGCSETGREKQEAQLSVWDD